MFAILRTAKISAVGSLVGSAKHALRERKTLNADIAKLGQNEVFKAGTAADVATALQSRLATLEKKVRKNAVLAIEYLFTATPKFFEDKEKDTRFFKDSRAWLEAKHGKENIICTVVHRDETTPHMTAYVVPITPDGRLSARDYLGGRKKLSDMQTSFADCVSPLGLTRGLEGSNATHASIKSYYSKVNAEKLQEVEKTLLIVDGKKEAEKQILHCKKTNQEIPEIKIIPDMENINPFNIITYSEIVIMHPERKKIANTLKKWGYDHRKIIYWGKEEDYEMEI